MRAVVQRVSSARVLVDGQITGQIARGLLVLVAVRQGEEPRDVAWMAEKVLHLRLFEDDSGKMNRSVLEVGGGILAVSQFTLYGDCRRGRRPSYSEAAPPDEAQSFYDEFVRKLRESGLLVQEGVFQAKMDVQLTNDGPVTVLLDSPERRGEGGLQH
ncbi:MAG: D-aminoacyl-tRNA deacylase [Candidatus Xenobium sp.]|jgi:D-tyrosyl-tRNA(Tyr) deacylase